MSSYVPKYTVELAGRARLITAYRGPSETKARESFDLAKRTLALSKGSATAMLKYDRKLMESWEYREGTAKVTYPEYSTVPAQAEGGKS